MYNIYCLKKRFNQKSKLLWFYAHNNEKSTKESNNKDYKMYKQFPEREDLEEIILSDIYIELEYYL